MALIHSESFYVLLINAKWLLCCIHIFTSNSFQWKYFPCSIYFPSYSFSFWDIKNMFYIKYLFVISSVLSKSIRSCIFLYFGKEHYRVVMVSHWLLSQSRMYYGLETWCYIISFWNVHLYLVLVMLKFTLNHRIVRPLVLLKRSLKFWKSLA